MNRRGWLAMLGVSLVLAGGCGPRANPEPLWIGHVAPFTGAERAIGEQSRQGIQQYVDQATAQGLKVAGRPIAVVHVDGRNNGETVQAEAVRLLTVNRAAALIGSLDATLAERLAREGQGHGVPVVLTGEVVGPGGSEVYCLGVDASRRGLVLGRLAEERGWDRIAVVSDAGSGLAGDLARAFTREIRKNAKAADREWTFSGDSDRTGWVDRAVKWQPKALLLACAPRSFLQGSEALRSAGYKGPLLYGGEDFGAEVVRQDGDGETYLATVCSTEGGLTTQGTDFVRKYQDNFKEKPGFAALQAFDAVRLAVELLQQSANQRQRDKLARLESFESLTGPVTFKDRRTRRKVFVLELKGQATQLVRTVEPETE